MRRDLIVCLALAVGLAGCGRSAEEQQEERQMEEAAQAAERGAEEATQGLEDMARALGALAGGGSPDGEKPVDPVNFRDLIALFPDVEGWEKGKPTGERMTSPFPFSNAEVEYTRGDARIEITMTDSGFNQFLLTPYAMFLRAGYERESTEGYEKSTQVNGEPGWEKWSNEGNRGELNALVGKRYLVQIDGRNVNDVRTLHEFANRLDFGQLAALK